MNSDEIRSRFLKFFEKRGHKIIPSASLVPENDPSVLFTTAGMQQFKLYYTGVKDALKDFGSKNTVSVQKCIRTGDIDEVGDDTHLTFFEMLGNFSFGGYWKKEAIEYAHEFITKELGLVIDYVSVFKDEESGIPADEESRQIWLSIDPNLKVKDHKKEDNFWGPTGDEGPCGPTTEIYINGVEIWNIVFNEYYKSKDDKYTPLEIKGIDTGMGLERLLVQAQKKNNVYETDLFENILSEISSLSKNSNDEVGKRIIADHLRTAIFMISDGVIPSNSKRGYVLRRLIRRAVYYCNSVGITDHNLSEFLSVVNTYKETEYDLETKQNDISGVLAEEEGKFLTTLGFGKKYLEKVLKENKKISGDDIFYLFTTFGFPLELSIEVAKDNNTPVVDIETYHKKFKEHQEKSRTASAGMFKGGLVNYEEKTIKLHTAHHLLLAGLQTIVGKNIKQRGSNITEERLRMDFLCDHKLTDEEKKKLEDWVNEKIQKGFKVIRKEMPLREAEKLGAEMEFGAKYPEVVSVYVIEDSNGEVISKEFCGGPHITSSHELGKFKIQKEEASAQGIRRIKAILE